MYNVIARARQNGGFILLRGAELDLPEVVNPKVTAFLFYYL